MAFWRTENGIYKKGKTEVHFGIMDQAHIYIMKVIT